MGFFSNILGKPFFKSPLTVFVEFEMCFYTLAVTVVIFCMIRLLRWSYRRVGDVWTVQYVRAAGDPMMKGDYSCVMSAISVIILTV